MDGLGVLSDGLGSVVNNSGSVVDGSGTVGVAWLGWPGAGPVGELRRRPEPGGTALHGVTLIPGVTLFTGAGPTFHVERGTDRNTGLERADARNYGDLGGCKT